MNEAPTSMPWPNAGRGQIPSLDGLRAISLMIVFFSHAGLSALIPGGFGVTVFFFLSGFLITTLLCREFARTNRVDFGAFYLRRILRLAPPLFLTMALAILLGLAGVVKGDLNLSAMMAQVFFMYNYYQQLPGVETSVDGLGVLWSLAVEEHFYLVWPLLFLLIAQKRIGIGFVIALIVAILLLRALRLLVFEHSEWSIYISTDTRFDSLLFGCLLAILMARNLLPDWLMKARVLYPLLALSVVCLLFSFAWQDSIFRSTVRYTIQGVALMPIFFYATRRSDHLIFQPLNWWVIRRIGLYSYTLYLIHLVMLEAFWTMGYGKGSLVAMAGAAVLSLIWAALVYQFAERPFHVLRARLNAPGPAQI
jgi:peptidoglycan/LPS O-acetylase OafA/YrhL